ncbi:SCO2522 family protein [Micromonospora robiginosa]|uniref:SCO2522 family protein n=1 Tax=Micromonospora robiginosa TaxID=2749844 RepID=A0A7L6BF51_9ACTN|nr:SCO2522 family protein [Micromonospora ferruginea]QLQ40548.2 SCO2522 family protein [Micromonospora ferruginea]
MGDRVIDVDVRFQEAAAVRRTESVAYSHLSVELGHFYAEDFGAGCQELRRRFARIADWSAAIPALAGRGLPAHRQPRISTCFMVDDYFHRFGSPREVIPQVQGAAADLGLVVDYVARESSFARHDGVELAQMVVDSLVVEPPRHTTGSRPPLSESGWLSNGMRSPGHVDAPAMTLPRPWSPPVQSGDPRHSIFVDVELWSDEPATRVWACALLASVWQMTRLGVLRRSGQTLMQPSRLAGELPADWDELPAVVQLNPTAAPFCAYRTLTLMDTQYLPVELAVRTILGQVAVPPAVAQQVAQRAGGEGLHLPSELVDRLSYVFIGG